MYFPSKKGIWLGIILWGANASLLWDVIIHPSIAGYVVIITFIPFINFLWFKTGYEITEQQLIIRSSPFKSTIPIADIQKLTPSKTLLAGPALSLDRIEIAYGLYTISPSYHRKIKQASPKRYDVIMKRLRFPLPFSRIQIRNLK